MRPTPSKRKFLRDHPAPPPTPEGMVWSYGNLVRATAVSADCAERMKKTDDAWEAVQKEKAAT